MWQSFEIRASEDTLDHALPGLVAPLFQKSERKVVVDQFFFVRTQSNSSTLHISVDADHANPVAVYLTACSIDCGVSITPGTGLMPAMPLSITAGKLAQRFAEYASLQSLYLLTRPNAERLARMCFFDALLAYNFLRSESAVTAFFRQHADEIEQQAGAINQKSAIQLRDRIYRPLRAMFHFLRTRKRKLAPRLADWHRACSDIANGFMVMAVNGEPIFQDSPARGTEIYRLLRYLIEEQHARLCFCEEDKANLARGISGLD